MSDNLSYVTCAPAQFPERPGRTWRGLTRRDLSPRIVARFTAKVNRYPADGCWEWTACRFPTGYGMFNIGRDIDGRQHTEYAHRIAYVLAHGDIADNSPLQVRHGCDNPPCCNPSHLQLGTSRDNHQDAIAKGRHTHQARDARYMVRRLDVLEAIKVDHPIDVAARFGVSRQSVYRWMRGAGLGRADGRKRWHRKVA